MNTAYGDLPVALGEGDTIIIAAFGYTTTSGTGTESPTKVVKEFTRANGPPVLESVSLSVFDDGTDDDYTVSWVASNAITDAGYDLQIQCFRETSIVPDVTATETSPDTNSSKLVTDTGGGDGVSDDHWAKVILKNSSGDTIATYTTDTTISTT